MVELSSMGCYVDNTLLVIKPKDIGRMEQWPSG